MRIGIEFVYPHGFRLPFANCKANFSPIELMNPGPHIRRGSKHFEQWRLEPGAIVDYEEHGVPYLSVILHQHKGKWDLLNDRGEMVSLPPPRLCLFPGKCPSKLVDRESRLAFLKELSGKVNKERESINLPSLWKFFHAKGKEIRVKDVVEHWFRGDNSLVNHIAMRRALVLDKIYFRRTKTGFYPRNQEEVSDLKQRAEIEIQRAKERSELIETIIKRITNTTVHLPPSISLLEELAVLGSRAENAKHSAAVLDEVCEKAGLHFDGRLEDRAFSLLVLINHFTPHENLHLRRAMRSVAFSSAAEAEATHIKEAFSSSLFDNRLDLSEIFTITIDGADTLDFDDAVSIERIDTKLILRIHISDVASLVPPNSNLEAESLRRGSAIYSADATVPMMPTTISENIASLCQDESRLALTFSIEMDSNCTIIQRKPALSVIKVARTMTYEEVDEILCGGNSDQYDRLNELLTTLWNITSKREADRIAAGAVQFHRKEMSAVLGKDGHISLQPQLEDTPARKLISELMILANESAALFAKENGLPFIYRSQESPDDEGNENTGLDKKKNGKHQSFNRYLKPSHLGLTPLPHFALGLPLYCQCTSPIRRALDLLNERQIVGYLQNGRPRYDQDELLALLEVTEVAVDEAQFIQRKRNTYWLLRYLQQENISEITGTVVRTEGNKPLAELDEIFATFPFQPIRKTTGKGYNLTLGERVKLKIVKLNPLRDIIRLEQVLP